MTTTPGAPGTAAGPYRAEPAPHRCPAGPPEPGRRQCDCRLIPAPRQAADDMETRAALAAPLAGQHTTDEERS